MTISRHLGLLSLGSIAALAACSDVGEIATASERGDAELAFQDRQGEVVTRHFAGREVSLELVDGHHVYEGDIILDPSTVSEAPVNIVAELGGPTLSYSTGRTSRLWPEGKIYYAIDPALPSQQRVTDAIASWEANSNLTFVKRTTEASYVYITPGSGCSSYIGMIGGKQNLTLSSGCSTGNTIHELGHAAGLWHEHSRVDRGASVKINWANIQTGREHNFKTYQELGFDGAEYTASLDFQSIMMYPSHSFSKNGLPTIVTTAGQTYSTQRSRLSDGDVEGIGRMYPGDDGEPEYINGQTYVIEGLTVLRQNDRWYYYSRTYGWKEVILRDGRWYWA